MACHGSGRAPCYVRPDGNINLLAASHRYFIGVPPDAPSQRHLYSVPSAPLARSPAVPHCLTCDLSFGDDNSTATDAAACLWNAATVSPAFGHFVLECLGPDVPSVFLVALNADGDNNNGTGGGGGAAVRLLERIVNGNFGNIFHAKSSNSK